MVPPGSSEGVVRMGMLFMSNEFGIMTKFGLGGSKTFLSITHDFERNYLISLR